MTLTTQPVKVLSVLPLLSHCYALYYYFITTTIYHFLSIIAYVITNILFEVHH